MSSNSESLVSKPNGQQTIPKGAHIALVRCEKARCMAYRPKAGQKWRDYFHHRELAGKVEVICYL